MTEGVAYDAILVEERRARGRGALLTGVIVAVCLASLWLTGCFDAQRLAEGAPAIAQRADEMVPPDLSRWERWVRPVLDTLAMSIAGTAFAVLFSLPLALLAARNTTPNRAVYQGARLFLSTLRAVPEIIMSVLFVAAVGFGALPGVLALGLHSVGMVGTFYAEPIEHVEPKPIEAARATGCGPVGVILHAVLPQVLPQLPDITIYQWEYHVRNATVLGIVGAGDIGLELMAALRLLACDQVSAILITILACVVVVDGIGAQLRKTLK